MLKLIIEDDEGRKTVVPFVRDEITIGRQEGNTIRLTERNVSRRHARLMKSNAHVLIEDLGSYNGIRINGDRIAGQVQVNDGDLIQIGDYDLAIQAEEGMAPTVPMESLRTGVATARLPEPSATLPALPAVDVPQASDEDVQPVTGDEPTPSESRLPSTAVIRADSVEGNRKRQQTTIDPVDAPRLVVLNTDFVGREFPCLRTELKVGRTDDNDIALDHRSLSRTHCKIVREDNGEWRVIDLQSANGLMVNGETYAQVTLRFGDVIELGHLKMQFVGPGEAAMAPSPSSITQEPPPVTSRAPLYAVLGAVAVIILGGGGYAFWKSRSPVTVDSTKRHDPVVAVKDPVKPSEPVVKVDPPAPDPVVDAADPELTRKVIAQKIADAKAAIETLDWVKAEALLKQCKLDTSIAPEAQQLLAQMDAEKGLRNALEEATRLLDAGNDDKARTLLDSARSSKLLNKRYAELEGRRSKLVAERLEKQRAAAATAPLVPLSPPRGKTEDAEALYREAADLAKAKQLEAAVIRLERCIKIAPMYFNCYKQLGSVHARIATRDNSAIDLDRARKYYERFLEYAPVDDESVPKVRAILETAPK